MTVLSGYCYLCCNHFYAKNVQRHKRHKSMQYLWHLEISAQAIKFAVKNFPAKTGAFD